MGKLLFTLLFFMGCALIYPQEITVIGTVTDSSTGAPIPGASVVQKNTTNGSASDFDGNYSIQVPSNAVLVFSSLGYLKKEIPVNDQDLINTALEEDAAQLEEVVVVGYGTQKVANLTGAVDVIDSETIQNRPSPTVSQLLQGTSAGLSFNVGDFGFEPGAELGIQIRGIGSINGGGSPYVVIDGIPGDLNRLNPEDIESISVLKDAAASAIYGARAPYGVIVVTTKSGKNQKLSVTYSGSVSVARAQNLPSMLNSYAHARVINEAGVAGAGGRFFRNDIIDNIVAFQAGNYDLLRNRENFPSDATFFETTPDPNNTNQWGFNQFGNANRDWFDEYFGSGYLQKHDVTISGGSEKTSYYFSAGTFGQEGVLNYGTDTFDRYNILAKITTAINDHWDFTYHPRYSKTIREIPNMDRQGSYDLIFHQIARTMPTNAKYDGYGNIMIQSKIPWVNDAGTDVTETIENWHTFATEIRPAKAWKINADFAYQNTDVFYQSKELTVFDNLVDQTQVPSGNTVPSNYRGTHRSNEYWTTNIYTSSNFNIGDVHNFSLLVGTQFERTKRRGLTAFRTNLLVQDIPSLNTADGEIQASENLLTFGTEGYFGRLNYNYKEKYLLEANARYDGTSRFREGKRWGFFPIYDTQLFPGDEALLNPRSPRTEVADFILSDLDNAIEYLGLRSTTGNSRLNKETALAFKLRVALFEGSWQKYHKDDVFGTEGADPNTYFQLAVSAGEELINGDYTKGIYNTGNPETDYYALFGMDNMSNIDEVLFYRIASTAEQLGHNLQFYTTRRTRDMAPTWSLVTSYLDKNGNPYDYLGLASTAKGNTFLSQISQDCDNRLSATIWIPGDLRVASANQFFDKPFVDGGVEESAVTGFQVKKYSNPFSPAAGADFGGRSETGYIIFRYAEVLLDYAEAKYELDGTVAAAGLNLLRERAGMPPFTIIPQADYGANLKDYGYTIDDALYAIRNERRVELALEGERIEDYKRWAAHNLFKGKRPLGYPFEQSEFPNYSTPLNTDGLIDFFQNELPDGYGFRENQDYLSPIPQDELTLNPNLTQNPGW